MRGGAHSKDIREYEITSKGVVIGERLTGYDGLITGIPRRDSRSAPKKITLARAERRKVEAYACIGITAKQKHDVPGLCRSLAESSPMPMAAVEGPDHLVPYVNPAFCLLFSNQSEELIGNPFSGLVQTGDECLSLLDRVYQTGQAEIHTGQEDSASHAFVGPMPCGRSLPPMAARLGSSCRSQRARFFISRRSP